MRTVLEVGRRPPCRPALFVGAVLAGLLITPLAARGADWPQWLGPSRNGVSSEIVPPWTSPPEVVWRHAVGNGYSSPIMAQGTVIIHAAVAGQDAEEVTAFDTQTGETKWHDTYTRARYRSPLGVGPRATPTAADGKLYTFGITGVLTCYDLVSGKRLWQTDPYDTFMGSLPRFGACSSPLVVDGRVIVMVGGTGSAVVAYDATSGELAWKKLDEPASSASPIVVSVGEGDDRRQSVVVQTTLRTVGLSPTDGSILWEHPLVFQPAGVSPTPLLIGRTLVCTTQDTGTLAIELPKELDGTPRSPWWNHDSTSYFSTGTLGPNGSALIITHQVMPLPRTDLVCVDVESGRELWKKEGLGYFHIGVVATGDGKLLFLDDSGNLNLAETTREGYKPLAKTPICRGTLTSPALAGGCVVVRDDKEVLCLRLAQATTAGAKNP